MYDLLVIIFPPNMNTLEGISLSYYKFLTTLVFQNPQFTKIPDNFLQYCESYEKFTIPSSVTIIGDYAFRDCYNLQIVFEEGSSLTSIGNGAFYNSGVANFTIPSSVKEIGNYAFQDCLNLTSIEIPDSVIQIGYDIISGCYNLVLFKMGNSCDSLPDFSNFVNLETVVLSTKITNIYSCSANCTSLRSIYNTKQITSVWSEAFLNCQSLTYIDLESCSDISNNAFEGCTSLSEINLPLCSYIYNNAFKGCTSLTKVNCSVYSIESEAFFGCINLITFIALSEIGTIGDNAFSGCNKLSDFQYYGYTSPTCNDNHLANLPSLKSIRIMNEYYYGDNEIGGVPIERISNNNEISHLEGSPGLSGGAIAGIVIAVIIIVAAVAGVCIFFFIIKPKQLLNSPSAEADHSMDPTTTQ